MQQEKFKAYNAKSIRETVYWKKIPSNLQEAIIVVSHVLPFRVNEYVLRELIDWNNIPDDPIFRMTFPHKDMLSSEEYGLLKEAIEKSDFSQVDRYVNDIRNRMNPHPAGQLSHNVPF